MLSAFSTTTLSFSLTQFSARLINSGTYPVVTDAMYLQPTGTAQNLGLCAAGTAYAYNMIAPQATSGTYISGNNSPRVYENQCGRYYQGQGGALSTVTAYTALFGTGNLPQSQEDCLRVCDYINYSGATCVTFTWASSICTTYSQQSGQIISDGVTNGGNKLTQYYVTDQPGGFGYKRIIPNERDWPAGIGGRVIERGRPVLTLDG
jgi:hypothetical protein